METVREDGAPPSKDAIHRACDAGADRHHPARQRPRAVGLHQQVHVIALERVVHDPEGGALAACPERALDLAYDAAVAEGRDVGAHAQRDVARRVAGDAAAGATGGAGAGTRLVPRARAAATPGASRRELEKELGGGGHDAQDIIDHLSWQHRGALIGTRFSAASPRHRRSAGPRPRRRRPRSAAPATREVATRTVDPRRSRPKPSMGRAPDCGGGRGLPVIADADGRSSGSRSVPIRRHATSGSALRRAA